MHRLRLIGRNPDKYDGYGYGNISKRTNLNDSRFIISGTQTGNKQTLSGTDYCLVTKADPYQNLITSEGPCKPSSEALTHAMVYRQRQSAQCIIHAHCPEIWHQTGALNLPYTGPNVPYGSRAMAVAVEKLFQSGQLNAVSLFTMLGHEDGIIAFGKSIQEAADQLIHCLAAAIAIDRYANCD